MTIQVLEGRDAKNASTLLARAVLASMATHSPFAVAMEAEERALIEQIILEVRQRISAGDPDKVSMSDIQSELAKEISSVVLSESRFKNALERAGSHGRLGTPSYDIAFADDFGNDFRPLGFTASTARKIIKKPDMYEHIAADRGLGGGNVFSLFVKHFERHGNIDSHFKIVQALRRGAALDVNAGWYIFQDEIDVSNANTPIDYLSSLVESFGEVIEMGGHVGKLLVNKHVDDLENDLTEMEPSYPHGMCDHAMSFSGAGWNSLTGAGIIHVAYSIDLGRYNKYLRAHRVR